MKLDNNMIGNIIGKLLGKKLTLGELMSIDQGRISRASEVQPRLVKVYHELKKESILDKFRSIFTGKTGLLIYYVIFKFEVKSKSGNTYEVFIKLSPDFSMTNWQNNTCEIYCGCKDFQYRSAYLLGKNDSLFLNDKIKIALGQALTVAPKEKTITTTLCKHSYACIQYIVKNYGNLMKTI